MSIFFKAPNSNEELREQLTDALTAAIRWYVLLPDKRPCDEQHAVTLIDQLEELQRKK